MTKWEYLIVRIESEWSDIVLEAELDAHGRAGWELVTIIERRAVFKRPLATIEKLEDVV